MRPYLTFLFFCAAAAQLTGCIMPYDPSSQIKGETGKLVVEGSIAGGETGTTIRLSRSFPVNKEYIFAPESRAAVFVEEESTGAAFQLHEYSEGTYRLPDLTLRESDRYRLHINTASGGEYLTDYQPVLVSPPIDSIYWHCSSYSEGATFYVATHDPTDRIQYYRWEYDEDWETQVIDPTKPVNIVVDWDLQTILYLRKALVDRIYCWRKSHSKDILLSDPKGATQGRELFYVQPLDDRLQYLYRIRLHQYPLDCEGYEFWENMRKNSEDIGDLFGPMPVDIPGNIRCVSNPDEEVLGYVSACVPAYLEQYVDCDRIFPNWMAGLCEFVYKSGPLDKYSNMRRTEVGYWWLQIVPDSIWLYYFNRNPYTGDPTSVNFPRCADCLVSGTKDKPLDWPNDHQ